MDDGSRMGCGPRKRASVGEAGRRRECYEVITSEEEVNESRRGAIVHLFVCVDVLLTMSSFEIRAW